MGLLSKGINLPWAIIRAILFQGKLAVGEMNVVILRLVLMTAYVKGNKEELENTLLNR